MDGFISSFLFLLPRGAKGDGKSLRCKYSLKLGVNFAHSNHNISHILECNILNLLRHYPSPPKYPPRPSYLLGEAVVAARRRARIRWSLPRRRQRMHTERPSQIGKGEGKESWEGEGDGRREYEAPPLKECCKADSHRTSHIDEVQCWMSLQDFVNLPSLAGTAAPPSSSTATLNLSKSRQPPPHPQQQQHRSSLR